MAKKVISGFPVLSAKSLATSFDTYSSPTNIDFLDNVGLLMSWSNALSPVGIFEIWVSNKDKGEQPSVASDYVALNFGSNIAIDGTNTSHVITLNQLPFSWIAFKYTATSGSGSLDVKLSSKEI